MQRLGAHEHRKRAECFGRLIRRHSGQRRCHARGLTYDARVLMRMEPNAKLVGPNILSWDFTCVGCSGYTPGRDWTLQMRDRYRPLYRTEPPPDIWTIHTYDLDWQNLPQGNTSRQIAQVQGLRTWLKANRTLGRKPIRVTKVGYHRNYLSFQKGTDGKIYPLGAYAADHLDRWMRDVFGWINANTQALRIDRWFIVLTYTEAVEPWMGGTRRPGIEILDGPLTTSMINRFGLLYQHLARV